jgi:hypothetical protein
MAATILAELDAAFELDPDINEFGVVLDTRKASESRVDLRS